MAEAARRIAKESDLDLKVWDEKRLAKEGYNGLIQVGRGSSHPPRMIRLAYRSKKAKHHLAFVGKGITFDTGGISIKPADKMWEMKGDMSGGAAVLYAMKAIGKLKPELNVTGIVTTAENSPDANAQLPGDIFFAKNGKSIMVDNTDAEGRLVLTDGLYLAGEEKATHIIDIATLTGACRPRAGNEYRRDHGQQPATDPVDHPVRSESRRRILGAAAARRVQGTAENSVRGPQQCRWTGGWGPDGRPVPAGVCSRRCSLGASRYRRVPFLSRSPGNTMKPEPSVLV